jgi:hypothetical protein
MAEWWQDPEVMAELEAAGDDVRWHKTGWVDPETGEKAMVPIAGIPSDIQQAYNPTVIAREATLAAAGTGSFQEFAAQYELDETGKYVKGTTWTPWELFHMDRQPGGSPFMDPSSIEGDPSYTGEKGGHDSGFAVGETDGDPAGTGAADDTVRRNMEDAFVSALQKAGLESDLIKTLWTWAEDKLVSDPSFTATRALLEMYDHEAFQARFPALKAMHDAGVTRRDIPTPGQYILYENEIVREMNRVGINADDVTVDTVVEDLLVGRVGIDEAISRLDEAKRMMYDVPEAVKEIFLAWAPTDSEGNTTYPESSLMLAFLDPDDKWSDIQEQIAAAETAGGAKLRAGLDISREMAERVANVSNDQAAIWNQFANLKQKEALFAETLTENIDLDMATHGVVGEFQLEGIGEGEDYMTGLELSDLITRRGQRRSAAFSGGGGAMLAGTTTGFGAANA